MKQLLVFLLAAATFMVFLPALQNGFTSWDDALIIVGNDQVAGWSWANTGRIFTTFHYGLYHPLVLLSFGAEHRLFGFAPFSYHLDNVLLHVANTVLVFVFIVLLGGGPGSALVTALLFGLHPTRVESVAWAMERKDLLFTFFFFASLLFYVRKTGKPSVNNVAALGSFLCALLAKAAAISLPVILLLIDYFNSRRIDRENLRIKAPFFLLAMLFGVVALLARILTGDLTRDPPFGPVNVLIGSYRLIFYFLPRILWPFQDYALYPGDSFAAKSFGSLPLLFVSAPLLAIILVGLFIFLFRRQKEVLFGGAFFVITILPALFMISIGPFADRFTYVPAVGLFYLFALGVSYLWTKAAGQRRLALVVFLALLFFSLGIRTWQGCRVWRDSLTLWDAACEKYPLSPEAFNQRALAQLEKGDEARALQDFRRALSLNPKMAGVYLNLGNYYFDRGDDRRALENLDRALALDPGYAEAYNNRGNVYGRRGEKAKALADYEHALKLRPGHPAALHNRYYLEHGRDL